MWKWRQKNPVVIELHQNNIEDVANIQTGDCVIFAIKVWQEMNGPDTFGRTNEHGAYMLQDENSILVVDSIAKKPFVLKNDETFKAGTTIWTYKGGLLTQKEGKRVNILFKCNTEQNVCWSLWIMKVSEILWTNERTKMLRAHQPASKKDGFDRCSISVRSLDINKSVRTKQSKRMAERRRYLERNHQILSQNQDSFLEHRKLWWPRSIDRCRHGDCFHAQITGWYWPNGRHHQKPMGNDQALFYSYSDTMH